MGTPTVTMTSSMLVPESLQLLPQESTTAVPPSGANKEATVTLLSSEMEELYMLPLGPATQASPQMAGPPTAPAGPTERPRGSLGGSTWSPQQALTASRRLGGDTPSSLASMLLLLHKHF